jgi:hypothetical protein
MDEEFFERFPELPRHPAVDAEIEWVGEADALKSKQSVQFTKGPFMTLFGIFQTPLSCIFCGIAT